MTNEIIDPYETNESSVPVEPVEPPVSYLETGDPVPIENDPAPPMVNPDSEITSVFMKVSRAVDGDDFYRQRVEMALEILGLPIVRANIVHITKEVAESIVCTVNGTVDTTAVTDDQISEAIETAPIKN